MPAPNENWLGLIAARLRGESEVLTGEPLPRRWVDLIRHLDEQERKRSDAARPAPGDAGRAPGRQN
jgi:hypothetical protein